MRPVLFSVFGFDIQSYGASKAVAALVAAYLLARAFERLGLKRDPAYSLVMWATTWGFVGAKAYYLLEQLPNFDLHHLGGMGFTWYGGLIGGVVAAVVIVRRHRLPLGVVAGATAIPLTLAYGIGRLGCLLSGDGTYGKPTSVPWAMSFPNGVMPTNVPVHPTPLYETLATVVIALVLWQLGKRWNPPAVFGAYLVLSGISRFLVEFLRINEAALLGLTQPQLWALASLITGVALIVRTQYLNRPPRAAVQSNERRKGGERWATASNRRETSAFLHHLNTKWLGFDVQVCGDRTPEGSTPWR
ncbi:MAG TPA: prolipoprotein diacylglyceryl transferase [Dermatophilaceae bacterium]